jgi:hypothetical protein
MPLERGLGPQTAAQRGTLPPQLRDDDSERPGGDRRGDGHRGDPAPAEGRAAPGLPRIGLSGRAGVALTRAAQPLDAAPQALHFLAQLLAGPLGGGRDVRGAGGLAGIARSAHAADCSERTGLNIGLREFLIRS